jgi:hypothetical protein
VPARLERTEGLSGKEGEKSSVTKVECPALCDKTHRLSSFNTPTRSGGPIVLLRLNLLPSNNAPPGSL